MTKSGCLGLLLQFWQGDAGLLVVVVLVLVAVGVVVVAIGVVVAAVVQYC